MKRLFPIFLLIGGFIACTQPTTSDKTVADSTAMADEHMDMEHNAQNSLDWAGTYEGTIPCADCPGIKVSLVLNEDETFQMTSEYLDRDVKVEDQGKLMWHDSGSVVHLTGKETNMKFKVGENQLFQLDQEGKEITGDLAENYIYNKKM